MVPEWKLEDDQRTISVSFPSTPIVRLTMDAAETDRHLAGVTSLRYGLQPEVARAMPEGQFVAVNDPIWQARPTLGDVMLHLRHTGMGWQHYALTPDQARAIANGLLQVADVAEGQARNMPGPKN